MTIDTLAEVMEAFPWLPYNSSAPGAAIALANRLVQVEEERDANMHDWKVSDDLLKEARRELASLRTKVERLEAVAALSLEMMHAVDPDLAWVPDEWARVKQSLRALTDNPEPCGTCGGSYECPDCREENDDKRVPG